jgi:hypothetical protein
MNGIREIATIFQEKDRWYQVVYSQDGKGSTERVPYVDTHIPNPQHIINTPTEMRLFGMDDSLRENPDIQAQARLPLYDRKAIDKDIDRDMTKPLTKFQEHVRESKSNNMTEVVEKWKSMEKSRSEGKSNGKSKSKSNGKGKSGK